MIKILGEPTCQLWHGDSAKLVLEPNSVDSIVSDPPCGIGFMGKKWDCAVPGDSFARAALRVLKPGGTLALATLLPGTQRELLQAWRSIDDKPHVNNFISAADLQQALLQAGLRSVSRQQSLLQEHYDSLTSLLRNLNAIGATNVNPGRKSGLGGRRALQQLDNAYPRERNGLLPLSYQVQWLLLRKEENGNRAK